CARGMVFFDYW
nr:immunoglobulin heavy chain junction region [Macaca mulatta]MOY19412.1 immunoglobulin heavy chain junction region [Macaca mulatta]